MEKRIKAALVLSLLSPFFGEVLSASTPPLEIINPITFLFLWGFYGCGALIMRRLWVMWGGGRYRLMLLGVSYGIIEEGLAIKSFFDPNWPDLSMLGIYGRCCGVNFAWAVALSWFHAVYSISVPIVLIYLFYPDLRDEFLLKRRGFAIIFLIFIFVLLITFFGLNPYAPPPLQYLITFLVLISILLIAWKYADKIKIHPHGFSLRHPFAVASILSFTIMFNNLIFPNGLYYGILHPAIPCATGIFLIFLFYSQMNLPPHRTMPYLMGTLLPFALFYDIIAELQGYRLMAFVGIVTFTTLVYLYKKMDFRDATLAKGSEDYL